MVNIYSIFKRIRNFAPEMLGTSHQRIRYMCKDVPELHEAYVWIMDMFKKIKKLRTIKSKTRRQKGYDQLIADMDKWVKIYRCYRGMKQIVTKVEKWRKVLVYMCPAP